MKSLNLSFNQIQELIPGTFEGLEFLEDLYIVSNRIDVESIDKKVFEGINSLKNLNIKGYEHRSFFKFLLI